MNNLKYNTVVITISFIAAVRRLWRITHLTHLLHPKQLRFERRALQDDLILLDVGRGAFARGVRPDGELGLVAVDVFGNADLGRDQFVLVHVSTARGICRRDRIVRTGRRSGCRVRFGFFGEDDVVFE